MKKIFNFILFISTLISSTGFASDTLFKEYKAGENINKFINLKDNKAIDCNKFSIAFPEVSKCYLIRDDYSIGNEKNFNVVLTTINDKVNEIIFFKLDNLDSLELKYSVWDELFTESVKGYSINEYGKNILEESKLKDVVDFSFIQDDFYQKMYKIEDSYKIETILIDTEIENNEIFNFINILSKEPNKVSRVFNIIEIYDYEEDAWIYKIQIVNVMNQYNLLKEIKER
ncbi:MAG: hypothetical protein AB7U51_11680 [Arcobacter sp.]|uniref:hypothetical protein n=1 Tax=Arcobacter sp. TaxID=1872629 RepID=UPI003D026714